MLASKSELERAMDKRRWQQAMEGKQREEEEAKTDLQRAIDQRAKKVRRSAYLLPRKRPSYSNHMNDANYITYVPG